MVAAVRELGVARGARAGVGADSLPTDSVQFALTETRSSILDTTEPIPESVHQRIIAQDVE